MDNKKLISIIIPVYNRREELKRCLTAIKEQTYRNFETIVIDDMSDIPIKDIVEDLKDNRFKYVRNEKQGGPHNARTVGWKICKGEYVVNIDSDWEPFPWMLERIIYYFNKFPFADGITGMHLSASDSRMLVRVKNGYRVVTPKDAHLLPTLPDCVGSSKKSVIDEFLKKSHDYFATESHLFSLSFFKKYTAIYVDEPWTKYYTNSLNRVTFQNKEKQEKLVNDCLLFLKDYQSDLEKEDNSFLNSELINRTIYLLSIKRWNEFIIFLKYINKRQIKLLFIKGIIKKVFNKLKKIVFKIGDKNKVVWI